VVTASLPGGEFDPAVVLSAAIFAGTGMFFLFRDFDGPYFYRLAYRNVRFMAYLGQIASHHN